DRRDLNDIHARTRVEEQGRVRHLQGAPSAGSIRASTPRIIPGQEHLSLFIPPVKTKPHEIPRLGLFGMPDTNLLGEPGTAKLVIILMAQLGAGNAALIYLAGLRNIPDTLYEAARIDGAGRLDRKSTRLNSSHVSISY